MIFTSTFLLHSFPLLHLQKFLNALWLLSLVTRARWISETHLSLAIPANRGSARNTLHSLWIISYIILLYMFNAIFQSHLLVNTIWALGYIQKGFHLFSYLQCKCSPLNVYLSLLSSGRFLIRSLKQFQFRLLMAWVN